MFSKYGKRSLAGRLALWYAVSSFSIVLFSTLFIYIALISHLKDEHDHMLVDKASTLHRFLKRHSPINPEVQMEVEHAFSPWKFIRNSTEETPHTFSRLLSKDGLMEFETPGMAEVLPSHLFPLPAEPQEDQAPEIIEVQSVSGKAFRILSVKHHECYGSGHACIIQIGIDHTNENKLLSQYQKRLALVLIVSLIACTMGGYRIAYRGLAPVREITAAAQGIGSATLHERIRLEGLPSELFSLATTFNKMLIRLEESFLRLTQFSADIAHELRTPISNLRGEAEVALRQPRSHEEYQELLGSSLEEYSRLSRLIDSLLFLARTEHPKTQIKREPVLIASTLAKMSEFYDGAAHEAGIELIVLTKKNEPAMVANLDRILFKRAVANLVSNAIRHTTAGGRVTVEARTVGTDLEIEVTDTGCGISADHLPHIFNRLYRVDQARSAHSGNLGLGLAITKRIVELHGGTPRIESQIEKGTRATLTFPQAIT